MSQQPTPALLLPPDDLPSPDEIAKRRKRHKRLECLTRIVTVMVGLFLAASVVAAVVVEWRTLTPRVFRANQLVAGDRTSALTALLVVITAASAVLVLVTLRRIESQARAQWRTADDASLAAVAQLMSSIDRLIFEASHLKRYFDDPSATLTRVEPDYDKVMTLAEMHVDLFDVVATNIRSNLVEGNLRSMWVTAQPEWQEWIVQSFAESHALREYYSMSTRRAKWYDRSLIEWHDRGCAEHLRSSGQS